MTPLRIGKLEAEFPTVLGGMSIGLTTEDAVSTIVNMGGYGTVAGVGGGLEEGIVTSRDFLERGYEVLGEKIRETQKLSKNNNILVNLMVAVTGYKESVGVAVENRVGGIASGAGLPLDLPGHIMEYADKYEISPDETPEMIPIVSSAKAARVIINRWQRNYGEQWEKTYDKTLLPSAVIVETPNTAGGHLGAKLKDIDTSEYSLETVVPQLVEMMGKYALNAEYKLRYRGDPEVPFEIPVIAAGGSWDRGDIDHMLALGAKGVQMSTRFIATDEINAAQEFKTYHMDNPNDDPIVVMTSPVGMPGRAYDNEFVRRIRSGEIIDLGPCVNCLQRCEFRDTKKMSSYCILRALHNVRMGDVERGVLFTGSNGHRLKEDRETNSSAVKIMQELTKTA